MLTLASTSETRAKMLRDAGVPIETVGSGVDEALIKDQFLQAGRSAAELVMALAEAKVLAVKAEGLVLGADQVLSFNGEIFDKPRDLDEAREQLSRLRGQSHALLSAAAIVEQGVVVWRFTGCVELTMRDFSDEFLDAYIRDEGDALLWTVGGYRIEGRGAQLFSGLSGDYFSILGLPLLEVLQFLRERKALIA